MSFLQALILGLVQGLTEFVPISSTAHVRVVPALLGWPDPGPGFSAVIQLGTLLAVLVYFQKDVTRALLGWIRGLRGREAARTPESRLGWAVFYGTIPISIVGLALKEKIEGPFRSLYVVAAALIGMALVLLLAEWLGKRIRQLEDVKPRDGWIVGLFQALALIPGASRSGSTIAGAMLIGFTRSTAARFSFVLSVPAIFLSGLFELYDQRSALMDAGAPAVITASLAAFAAGYASIEFLMRFLRTHSTAPFIIYRIAGGTVLLLLLANGVLSAAD